MNEEKTPNSGTGSLFGIETFISGHTGFSGQLKQTYKDFLVTEIDVSGKMVQFDSRYTISASACCDPLKTDKNDGDIDRGSHEQVEEQFNHLESNSDKEQTSAECILPSRLLVKSVSDNKMDPISSKKRTGLDISNLKCLQSTSVKGSDICQNKYDVYGASCTKPASAYLTRLQEILGADLMKELTAFAEREYNLHQINKPCSHTQTVADSNSALSVGVLSSKETRAEIHSHIKYLFPHLCTKVEKLSSSPDDSLSITAHSDSIYWNFQKCLAADEINDFIRFVDAKDASQTFSLTNCSGKEERTRIHREIAKHYGAFLETKTFVSSDRSSSEKTHTIVVRYRPKFVQRGMRGRGQKRKVSNENIFTGFVLKKENLEMLDAINKMATVLKIQPSDFSYAGIKDKKAVSTQAMSVKGITPEKMKSCLSKIHQITGITTSNFQRCQGPIQMGQLSGNHFEIVVRDIYEKKITTDDRGKLEKLEEQVLKAVENVKVNMFINYFGQQRFGSGHNLQENAPNVGLAVLQGDHVKAVNLILSPELGKEDAVNRAKQHFQETRAAKSALNMMPNFMTRECMLLKALHRHGTDTEGYINSLLNIPHAMRQLYIHSYCSLVWNKMATQRVRMYVNRLVEGDLVIPPGTPKALTRKQVQVVTKETINSFTIQDLVLPLPGNAIQYPSNNIGQLYREQLEQAGLSQSSFRISALKINIPGDYRKVFASPHNLACSLFCDKSLPLQQNTSLLESSSSCSSERVASQLGSSIDVESNQSCSQFKDNIATEDSDTTGDKIHLRLSFSLPASSYATMCLREIMKQ